MGAYRGYAALADQPESRTDVEVRLGDSRLVLSAGQTFLGDWPLAEISLARHLEGFVLRAEGEALLLSLSDADAFWSEATTTDGRLTDTVETLELRTPGDEPVLSVRSEEAQPLPPGGGDCGIRSHGELGSLAVGPGRPIQPRRSPSFPASTRPASSWSTPRSLSPRPKGH
ncbi:hypothetical protein BH23ACT5_BH23ACT5_01520 [soil metagenome]